MDRKSLAFHRRPRNVVPTGENPRHAPQLGADGSRQGVHYWNRLAGGVQIDLTREQFTTDEHVGEPAVVAVPPGAPGRLRTQHALLRQRVHTTLGLPLRTSIGSLAGQADLSGDWDSPETNAEIAVDFGA
jgi:hypothetical protein